MSEFPNEKQNISIQEIIDEISVTENPESEIESDKCDKLVSDISNFGIDGNDSDSGTDESINSEVPDETPPDNLTEEEIEINYKEAIKMKLKGNDEFKEERFIESANYYTKALKLCPVKYATDRSVLFANRAAAKSKIGRSESAIEDCTKSIELNSQYLKAYLRRAKLYEETSKLDESLEDYKKILELDPHQKDALEAQVRLPPKINERNEALKAEMLGKMKDLGNLILRPFGLSTDNFQVNQDPNTGSYSINFNQNPR